jgi:hypothetical protein
MMTAVTEGAQYSPGALSLIEDCEPLSTWERLEKGDMHYFAALCAHERGYSAAEPTQLGQAEAAYRRIPIELSGRRHRWPRKTVEMRDMISLPKGEILPCRSDNSRRSLKFHCTAKKHLSGRRPGPSRKAATLVW